MLVLIAALFVLILAPILTLAQRTVSRRAVAGAWVISGIVMLLAGFFLF